MVVRLIATLRALADQPPGQAGAAPVHGPGPEALALEYADAWLLARQCPGLEFTSAQIALLDQLEGSLESVSGAGGEATRSGDWAAVRALARRALVAIGHDVDPSNPSPR